MPKGTKLSASTRKKMSESRTSEKNPNWKGGMNTHHITKKVKERDNYTCQQCGLRDEEIIVVDHINPRFIRPDLAFHPGNLQCLCPNCHARKTKVDRKIIALFKKDKEYVRGSRYQKSHCKNGYLHDFVQVDQTATGYVERCTRCGIQMHFPLDTPNAVYLSYHLRSALQPNDVLFLREYPNVRKK